MPAPTPRTVDNRKAGRALASAEPARPPETPATGGTPEAPFAEGPRPEPAEASSLDAALSGWAMETSRAQMACAMSVFGALVGASRAVREVQRDTAERAEAACEQAGERLQSARDLTHAATLQAEWLRAQGDEALRYWTRLSEIAGESGAQTFQRALEGWTRASTAAFEGMSHWARVQAALPTSAEAIEAEAEHLTNPLSASPLAWPAQEAVRQGVGLATSLWNDWLDWSKSASGQTVSDHRRATVH